MQPNQAEMKQQEERKLLRLALGRAAAEPLLQLIGRDETLLSECLELVRSSAGYTSITQWLCSKRGLPEADAKSYKFCEAVLNLSIRSDRHA